MALSDNATRALADFLETEGRLWVRGYIVNRKASLRKRKINAAGDLSGSMQGEVTQAFEAGVRTTIDLMFADHGRYIDIKRLKPAAGGGDYIDGLVEWIERKGFREKFVSGFLRRRRLKREPQDVLNQIAWGIVKKRSTQYRRRSPWLYKSSAAAINTLYNRVASRMPQIVAEEIAKQFPQ